jgi:mono/diheme cytochrome c family protein
VNDAYSKRPATMRRTHASGVLLLLAAGVLGVLVVIAVDEWRGDPGAPGRFIAGLVGGPSLSLDTSGQSQATVAGGEGAGVPRSRTGLVATSENRGQVLFGRYCDSCHTAGREMIGPSLRTAQFKGQYKSADEVIHFVRTGGFDMPAFPEALVSDEELQKIADYVVSLPEDTP